MNLLNRSLLALGVAAVAVQAQAQAAAVDIDNAWARATVQGQSGTGAFMRLTAREPLSLVGASSPVAGVAEVHEMRMEGDVMRMRPVTALDLPVGKSVELRPGGHHLMLMDLKAPLKPGTQVPVTLLLRNGRGETQRLQVSLPVRTAAPAAAGAHKH